MNLVEVYITKMEETVEKLISLRRHLNSIEHMIYVSCKFTRTTEMLRKVMETIVVGYEGFFTVAYASFVDQEEYKDSPVSDKVAILSECLAARGINIDLSDYFLLKRLLLSEFDSIGEYRKNLCMVSYIDGDEHIINMSKLLDFYDNLKLACSSLSA
jgi:hypothetical protein